ncbi:hypothetical protein B0T17DRAFT_627409, partial [Bombardia bombarda]
RNTFSHLSKSQTFAAFYENHKLFNCPFKPRIFQSIIWPLSERYKPALHKSLSQTDQSTMSEATHPWTIIVPHEISKEINITDKTLYDTYIAKGFCGIDAVLREQFSPGFHCPAIIDQSAGFWTWLLRIYVGFAVFVACWEIGACFGLWSPHKNYDEYERVDDDKDLEKGLPVTSEPVFDHDQAVEMAEMDLTSDSGSDTDESIVQVDGGASIDSNESSDASISLYRCRTRRMSWSNV